MASCALSGAESHMRISASVMGGRIDAGVSVAWAAEKDG